jgi:hypothetical protein
MLVGVLVLEHATINIVCSTHSLIFHSSMALQPFVGPWPIVQFRNLFYTDGRTPWTSDQPVAKPLPSHRTKQTQNKRIYKHPCIEWDSNSRSQCSNERRQFMTRPRGHCDRHVCATTQRKSKYKALF